jgi:DNA-directed RNA polymerase subunit beta'
MIDFPRTREPRSSDFDFIQLKIASPEEIRSWSYGEVTKPETINYRSFKPERDGLFCERIFGPVKDWECHCGKFKRIRFRGHICDKCGVEVTLSKVRRERMGHIELAVPVAHIWFFKTLPSQMGYLLGITLRDLEKVIYYASYVVTNPGRQELKYQQLLDEDEYYELRVKAREEGDNVFRAEIGGEGIRTLLRQLDASDRPVEERNRDGKGLDRLAEMLRGEVATETSQHRKKMKLKRLKVVDAIRNSGTSPDTRNKPDWLIMDAVPVIPPDLRPLVPLDGGRFATSDLNDLYRRVINRNNRLKKLMEMRAPEVILRNEKRMLQEAVDALFDNGRRSKAIRGRGKRPLKSLSDMLKGKQGRFRQNLLGKRVDYSGRSVIVVGPELKLHQCGLPKLMAVELFKPFIIHELEKRGEAETVKRAKKLVERDDPKVYEVLEEIIKDHPVLLNRAPTLHRLGIQAFEPVLVEGKAIRIHPLVCAAFNADFDGDQMAVHVPLSFEAQLEARVLMLSSNNILLPSNGRPVASPSQDMVIGSYYLTKPPLEVQDAEDALAAGRGGKDRREKALKVLDEVFAGAPRFGRFAEAESALALGRVRYRTPCWFWAERHDPADAEPAPDADAPRGKWERTTVGRVLFNSVVPEQLGYWNQTMGKKELGEIIFQAYRHVDLRRTTEFLDALKDFGFRFATMGGISVGLVDLVVPEEKGDILREAEEEVSRFTRAYQNGVISNGERYNKVIDTWTHANNDVADAMVRRLERSNDGFNSVFMMMNSGARGNRDQMRQLAGMRGLMAKPQKKLTGGIGEIIESPIKSNFREGLTVLEYFISTHGARKGLADTALKTADAGYLTRRLVDVAQDVTIAEEDCGTILGVEMTALKEGEDIIEPLKDRIVGNVALEDVYDPIDGELIVHAGELIDEEAADTIEDAGIQSVKIRSVLTCESKRGICQQCYGRNLATMGTVDLGEAVGILAAQSIGEPGTQLTLRTFHIGGTAARIAAQTQRKSKVDGKAMFERITFVETPAAERIVTSREGEIVMMTKDGAVRSRLAVPYGATLAVPDEQQIESGDLLFSWDPYSEPIVADHAGKIRFVDIVEDETVREELDESTGRRQLVITEDRDKRLHPMIEIWDRKGSEKLREFIVPVGAQLTVRHGDAIEPGTTLAKISREVYKTRDITGGLPRVAELFEARRPKDPAVITEIDGVIRFGEIKRGKREILVQPPQGAERVYEVPVGKHLRVHEADQVRAGDRLSEGPVNPHDILRIKGPRAVQEYLLNEVQEVYRLQGVKINDKHIGVIVRQMLQKVRITDSGDSEFLESEHVDRVIFRETNQKLIAKGHAPARSEPLLLGITKASLTTQSFISAASFQETTRVLTDAAVRGARDELVGLKENIIIGHLIPAGTGIYRAQDVEFQVDLSAGIESEMEARERELFPGLAGVAESEAVEG